MSRPAKTVLGATALLLLAACSGGGGFKAPSPVIAGETPPMSFAEFQGIRFPYRVATLSDVGPGVGMTVMGVTFVTEDLIKVEFADGRVVNFEDSGGGHEAEIDGRVWHLGPGPNSEYANVLVLSDYDGSDFTSLNLGIMGFEASQASVDARILSDDVVAFMGGAQVAASVGGVVSGGSGTTSLLVDFGTGKIAGEIYESSDLTMSLVDGTLAGTGMTGTLSFSGPEAANYALVTSMVQGTFYGQADELAGTFAGTGDRLGEDYGFIGAFLAAD